MLQSRLFAVRVTEIAKYKMLLNVTAFQNRKATVTMVFIWNRKRIQNLLHRHQFDSLTKQRFITKITLANGQFGKRRNIMQFTDDSDVIDDFIRGFRIINYRYVL